MTASENFTAINIAVLTVSDTRTTADDTSGDASDLHFPSFGAAAARLLVDERGVAILGVDTASIDAGSEGSR